MASSRPSPRTPRIARVALALAAALGLQAELAPAGARARLSASPQSSPSPSLSSLPAGATCLAATTESMPASEARAALAPGLSPEAQPTEPLTLVEPIAGTLALGGHGGTSLWSRGHWHPLLDPEPADLATDDSETAEPADPAPAGPSAGLAAPRDPRTTFALAFAGDLLIEAGGQPARRAELRAWEWKSGTLAWSQSGGTDVLYCLATANARLYAGGADSKIAVLELATGTLQSVLEGHSGPVLALAASPDSTTLVSAGVDRSLRVWDLPSHTSLRAIHNHGDSVLALAWSPDGRYLASASADRTVRIWQPRIGRLVRILQSHDSPVLSLAYTPTTLATGAANRELRLLDPQTDQILETRRPHSDWIVALTQLGPHLVSTDWTGHTILWTPEPQILRPPSPH